jgi:hypothetical protein
MRLACHIRHVRELDHLAEIPDHLQAFYRTDESARAHPQSTLSIGPCTRIYVGDEFCVARMPTLPTLKRLAESASAMGLALTLLTPVMTDVDIPRMVPLFDYLNTHHPGAEVVFNDWGVMGLLKSDFPAFKLSAGRLLNKGFKDPRLQPEASRIADRQAGADALLTGSTLDGQWIQEHLTALDIHHCEQDLLPYRSDTAVKDSLLETAIYFPFGYITTGRTCWVASFDQPAGEQFIPPARCSRPCCQGMLELKSEKFSFRIFQSGNTIFYLYPRQALDRLIAATAKEGARLIYQGFGLDES